MAQGRPLPQEVPGISAVSAVARVELLDDHLRMCYKLSLLVQSLFPEALVVRLLVIGLL